MGTIIRSAAATVMASISVLAVSAGTGQHTLPGSRATETANNPPVIVCADSMVWDGHQCVVVTVHP